MQDYIKKQTLTSLCVFLGQIVMGFAIGWSSPIIPKLQNEEQSPLPEPITSGQASWLATIVYIGGIPGSYLSSYISNKFGRKLPMYVGGFLSLAAYLLLATAYNMYMIYVGRFLVGCAIGQIQLVSTVYLGEIASPNIRGIILTASAIFFTAGVLVVYVTSPFVSYAATNYILMGFITLYNISLFYIPESPIYYVLRGNEIEAILSMKSLGRTDKEDVDKVLATKPEKTTSTAEGWSELFSVKSNRRALFITVTINTLQQVSGVMPVALFATTIFEMAGSTIQPHIASIIMGITQLVGSILAPVFVERNGRKFLLMVSCAFCCISLAVLGTYFYFDHIGYDLIVVGWLPLLSLIMFFLAYDIGFSAIPGTLLGEMYSGNARTTGYALTISCAWIFGFATSTGFGYVIDIFGAHVTFWIFAGACATAFFFTLFCIPETKGKSLLEVQEMLSR